ncbi:secretion system protein [Pseudomonas sp. Z1-29]|uniref:secretion system protein n=1 Tax=Pseudomonas sp. Z1-29 TaxID=2817410 RepID=UPI003DA8B660
MSSEACLQAILAEPLAYLHRQRLVVPAGFDGPEARSLLNRMVLDGLALQGPGLASAPLTAVAQQWVRHWQQLPYIARLIGAARLMPDLARGAALLRLAEPVRRFACYGFGSGGALMFDGSPISVDQVDAAGLNALSSWCEQVPPHLLERLPLQFSEPVVRLHRQWPLAKPDPALFFLAVQHARLHPNPD